MLERSEIPQKKSLSRDKPVCFYQQWRYLCSEFHSPFLRRFLLARRVITAIHATLWQRQNISLRAKRMPNAYPNHKCVDTHCRSAIGHATAYIAFNRLVGLPVIRIQCDSRCAHASSNALLRIISKDMTC